MPGRCMLIEAPPVRWALRQEELRWLEVQGAVVGRLLMESNPTTPLGNEQRMSGST